MHDVTYTYMHETHAAVDTHSNTNTHTHTHRHVHTHTNTHTNVCTQTQVEIFQEKCLSYILQWEHQCSAAESSPSHPFPQAVRGVFFFPAPISTTVA